MCCYIVLYFLPKRPFHLPPKYKIRCFIIHQISANIHWSVPTCVLYPAADLYTSADDLFILSSSHGKGPSFTPQTRQIKHNPFCRLGSITMTGAGGSPRTKFIKVCLTPLAKHRVRSPLADFDYFHLQKINQRGRINWSYD